MRQIDFEGIYKWAYGRSSRDLPEVTLEEVIEALARAVVDSDTRTYIKQHVDG